MKIYNNIERGERQVDFDLISDNATFPYPYGEYQTLPPFYQVCDILFVIVNKTDYI